jgi:hypothetical protein
MMMGTMANLVKETKTKALKKRVAVVAARTTSMEETTSASTVTKPTSVILHSTPTQSKSTLQVLMERQERPPPQAEAVADLVKM